ncbi:MAG TPA: S53 family peptidase [Acidobacteriaceae bacterium]|nr:S53 family peptidase [Acidobacteriaceae bacterium]
MKRLLQTSLLSVVAAALAATAFGQTQLLLTHHLRQVQTNGQARVLGQMPASQTLHLTLTLPLRNEAELDTLLADLYNPSSPSYRHFLTVAQFTAEFGPTQDDYNAVLAFAEEHGLKVVGTSPNRLNVDVTGTVAQIQQAFRVTMRTYQHPTENRTFFAPDREPSVDLPFQLWHIHGLSNYSIPHPAGLTHNPDRSAVKASATVGSGPSASFLGSDMRAAYYGNGSLTGAGQSLGLLEYYGTDLADVTTYFSNVHQTNNVPITLLSTDGTSTSCVDSRAGGSCDDTEQTLDITQAIGMAPGLSSLIVYVGSSDASIFNSMATHNPLNAQLSSSWTWNPADPSTDDPYFKEFAAQGQNLFQAAGDSAKWTTSGTASETYPADDPYLTSVGGTDLSTSSAAGPWASETGWADSGGGISPHNYAIPSWQTATAASCSSCSKSYRNGPDVSANANFTFYVCADQTTCTANDYGGTSFAAPMWAGFLALVNQQSVASGGKPLGFINPTLYSLGQGSSYDTDFHDITSGSNGYSATTGYDLVTGWGSPTTSLISALLGSSTTQPGFSLSASPGSVSVVQGSEGSTTITSSVTGGFSSAIALSASGQPSGLTIGFSPTSITGAGNSSMSLTVSSSTTPGTYTITVKGTSGSTVETTTVSLTVTSSTAGFSVSASPTSISIARRSSGQVTITTATTGGFDSAIALSASGQGSANSVGFSPSSITGAGSSTMTITVGRNASPGNHTITVTATSGSTRHTTTVTLDVLR